MDDPFFLPLSLFFCSPIRRGARWAFFDLICGPALIHETVLGLWKCSVNTSWMYEQTSKRHSIKMVKGMASETRRSCSEYWHYKSLEMWSWERYWTSPGLSFLLCEIRIRIITVLIIITKMNYIYIWWIYIYIYTKKKTPTKLTSCKCQHFLTTILCDGWRKQETVSLRWLCGTGSPQAWIIPALWWRARFPLVAYRPVRAIPGFFSSCARYFSVKMDRSFLLLLFLLCCSVGESRDLRSGLQSQDRGGSLGHSIRVGGFQAGLSLD